MAQFPSSTTGAVHSLLDPVVARTSLVLEDVTITPAGKRRVVRVVVDLPDDATGSLDLDQVAEVSRAVADALEGSDVLGGTPYVLEVTSPGVDRPLTERRHWSRARGRLVLAGDTRGRVVSVSDDGVALETEDGERTLPWDELGTGHIQVEFHRIEEA
ncbi:MAG TPA: ribosome maturation factor RimP [Actinomycetales bacterium]|nr:ribosome maturation factor RimP [Actinomycetales bacterium]